MLAATLRTLRLDDKFLYAAIRCKSEDWLRDEIAYALEAHAPGNTFIAPGVAVGGRRRADIGELHGGDV